jgi:hypothetical protein
MEGIFKRDPLLESAIVHRDVDTIKAIFFGTGQEFTRVRDGVCPRRAAKIAHRWALENRTLVGGHFKTAHLM